MLAARDGFSATISTPHCAIAARSRAVAQPPSLRPVLDESAAPISLLQASEHV